jgi:transcription elongation GreA/GreB family factor
MTHRTDVLQPHLLTAGGYRLLSQRQHELQTAKQRILEQLQALFTEQASEPFDATATLQQLHHTDAALEELQATLRNARICTNAHPETIQVGAQVTLLREGKELTLTVVDSAEADPLNGSISL